ncbi:MAG: hypothetical protein QOI93_5203, partial [Rhodospirillaceae bacterium]|nr:hypothetical protein [Rhodospirillaceae bacterium]
MARNITGMSRNLSVTLQRVHIAQIDSAA